ncbi:hypothetical protein [Daejeonella oryzae]|uniref:hypothetical protein n=1 Tax=Daejeonella oryzae TaxID=1122943 RepID=UPI0004115D6C|nr:hypothetical protein [Daejeonella oryzae]
MNTKVESALKAALKQFAEIGGQDSADLYTRLQMVFDKDASYLDKVAEMDDAFDDQPAFEALREVVFDLLLINFFTEDVQKLEEDYLDSEEWEDIEEETLDRGTELLNVLLYIKECEDEDLEPELGDFLKEFLLVDEDEFQDEHRIYEDVIANQVLVDSSLEEVARVANDLPEFSELKELFYPLISFFRDQKPADAEFESFKKYSQNAAFDAAVYSLLISYNK